MRMHGRIKNQGQTHRQTGQVLGRGVLVLCLLMFISLLAMQWGGQAGLKAASEEMTPYKVTVNVDMVVLPVTVLDHKGCFVNGLEMGNFEVYENGQLQVIKRLVHEDAPVTVGLVLDNSGSMGPDVGDVNAAALEFANSSNPNDQLFVVKFNEKVKMGLPPEMAFTDDVNQLRQALERSQPRGKTALYDAISLAVDHLQEGNCSNRILIVLSDGGDNASHMDLSSLLTKAQKSNVLIYTIAFFKPGMWEQDAKGLQQLAKMTGGRYFQPTELNEVEKICLDIAREIRHQYVIEYTPSDANQDGTYRAIRVTAIHGRSGKLQIRTRAGYVAPDCQTDHTEMKAPLE